jgi:hypothetical protein
MDAVMMMRAPMSAMFLVLCVMALLPPPPIHGPGRTARDLTKRLAISMNFRRLTARISGNARRACLSSIFRPFVKQGEIRAGDAGLIFANNFT